MQPGLDCNGIKKELHGRTGVIGKDAAQTESIRDDEFVFKIPGMAGTIEYDRFLDHCGRIPSATFRTINSTSE